MTEVEQMTAVELERQRAERAAAFTEARKLLWTIESEVEDILVVADWLLTGRATLALEFSAQTARNYREHDNRSLSPDAATWLGPPEPALPEWEQELLDKQGPTS